MNRNAFFGYLAGAIVGSALLSFLLAQWLFGGLHDTGSIAKQIVSVKYLLLLLSGVSGIMGAVTDLRSGGQLTLIGRIALIVSQWIYDL
jgi:hypothetical protein